MRFFSLHRTWKLAEKFESPRFVSQVSLLHANLTVYTRENLGLFYIPDVYTVERVDDQDSEYLSGIYLSKIRNERLRKSRKPYNPKPVAYPIISKPLV